MSAPIESFVVLFEGAKDSTCDLLVKLKMKHPQFLISEAEKFVADAIRQKIERESIGEAR